MATPQFENVYKVDLALPLQKRIMEGFITSGDAQPYKISVDIYNKGVPITFGETDVVRGVVRKPDGTSVEWIGHKTAPNRVYIVLPERVCNVIGPVRISIRVQDAADNPTKKTTVLVLQAHVIQD